MSVAADPVAIGHDEVIELFERLPAPQRIALVDFARFLLARHAPAEDGDARWEAIIADPRPRPKLKAYVEAALAEGGLEPLDPEKL